MSYILDALRKSDQLRQRGASPALLLGQAPLPEPRQPALLSYGLLALGLLGAGIVIGWLRPWAPEPVAPAPELVAAKPPEVQAGLPPTPPAMAPRPAPIQSAPKSAPTVRAAPVAEAVKPRADASVKLQKHTAPPKAAAKPAKAAQPPAANHAAKSAPAEIAAPSAAMAMGDLPLAIQQELPPMSISVHAYSAKAADRLVGINNRLLHEGAEVAPGLKLEQITPEGMVLSYKGYRFRRGVH
jgi:general secretion pathway protein B